MISRNVRGRKQMIKTNVRVRDTARMKNVPLWRLAEEYGLSEAKFSTMLRHELPDETQTELVSLIEKIANDTAKSTISIDYVQVIRCKDCKFLRFTGTVWKCQNRLVMMLCEPNDYCSMAERKEE